MIFLSFAAEFDFLRALRHLFAVGTKRHTAALKRALLQRYQGISVQLYPNGRTALSAAIQALIPKGSCVAINGLTCYAVPQAVKSAACLPIYVDINSTNFNFDLDRLGETLKSHPEIKGMIIQNHLGLAADIIAIEKLAKKHQLVIIEDLAHCAGSHYADGREVGTVGDATALSFGKGKAIDTTEGGALILRSTDTIDEISTQSALEETLPSVTTDAAKTWRSSVTTGRPQLRSPKKQTVQKFANRARNRIYPITGWLIRKTFRIGLGKAIAACALKTGTIQRSAEGRVAPHLRLTHWQAKLALKQFESLSGTAKMRAKFAAQYGYPKTSALLRIPFLVKNRDDLLKKLKVHGILLDDPWYSVPVGPKRYYHRANFPEQTCPVATQVASQMLNLPLLPKDQLRVALELIQPEVVS